MTRSWKQSILFPGTQLLWNQNEALAFVRWLRFYLFILSKYWYISACTIRLQHLLFSCYREHFFLRCIVTPSKFLFVHNPQGTQCNAVNIIKQRLEALKISKVLFWENNYQDIFCLQRVKPTSNYWASTRFTEYHQSTISTLFWGSKLWIVLRPEKKKQKTKPIFLQSKTSSQMFLVLKIWIYGQRLALKYYSWNHARGAQLWTVKKKRVCSCFCFTYTMEAYIFLNDTQNRFWRVKRNMFKTHTQSEYIWTICNQNYIFSIISKRCDDCLKNFFLCSRCDLILTDAFHFPLWCCLCILPTPHQFQRCRGTPPFGMRYWISRVWRNQNLGNNISLNFCK